ncbi:MAG: hypothetical protein KDA65_12050, partial [Planctomycetaceae bacterium]|nr:hypothetical protein [Planctomycetaceae bacterium]
ELIPAEEATIPLVESEAQVEAVEQPVSESAPAPESSEDASAAKTSPKQKEKGDEESVAHSEATGADVLLNIALEEERETGRRKLQNLLPGMFIVYCPKGHRIKVREKHRGLTGKCPVCKAAFHVPAEEPKSDSEEAAGEESKLEEGSTDDKTIVTGSYSGWMQDVSQHRVDPARLKLRPGSLVKEFTPVDLAFSADGLLICELSKPGALFGGGPKKNPAIREEIYEHLRQGLSIDKLPGHKHRFFSTENFSELRIVQPCPAGQISLFHDIPVFGEGRIAIQIPRMDEGNELEFLSFSLSQFRSFVAGMRTVCGQADFAADAGIPLEENYELFKCHYTQQQVPALNQMDYYKADKSFELITVGYQCEKCGLVMSEEGRAAEKFGGAKGKSIAKAKCPGCEQKFGSMILEAIKDDPILAPEPENEEAEDETATAGEETSMEEVTPSEGASAESETEAKSEK